MISLMLLLLMLGLSAFGWRELSRLKTRLNAIAQVHGSKPLPQEVEAWRKTLSELPIDSPKRAVYAKRIKEADGH